MITVITLSDWIAIILITIASVFGLCISLFTWMHERKCKHDSGVRETSSRDAICRSCGKNLGFIGNIRKEKAK